jgi:hypothetical protein
VSGTTGQDLDGPAGAGLFFGGSDVFLAKFNAAGSLNFTRQLGTLADERAFAVAVDGSGSAYLTGSTAGDLDGPGVGDLPAGGTDFFLAKFDPAGNLRFTRQRGTPAEDTAFGVAAARLAVGGNVFVTGATQGDLDGNLSTGDLDSFLVKFDPFGNRQ